MHKATRQTAFAIGFCLAAVACHPNALESDARARLETILRDSLGGDAGAKVAFISDGGRRGSHLYLTFDTTVVPTLPESLFALHARDLARFATRHYDNASALDSITVATRELMQPGLWRVHRSRVFATDGL